MTASEHLGRFAVAPIERDAPVRQAARRHLLDGLGNAIAARRRGAGSAALRIARGLGGPGEAAPIGDTDRISAPAAAFADGVLVHALDFDDTHGRALVHPTAVTLPAALAVGQEVGASGAAVVDATAVGLEVACRIGAAVPHGFHGAGLHATGAVGPLAAAATAGRLAGLDATTVTAALGIAGSSSGGLLEFLDTGADTKTLHPGSASFNGILAARLAEAGAAGPVSVLEGRRGLFATMSRVEPDLSVVEQGLGRDWTAAGIGIKPYPSCQLMHAALDAARAAIGDTPAATIDAVSIDLHPDSLDIVGARRPSARPLSPYDAKFDVRWSVAALLLDGAVTLQTYDEASIARPEVAELAARIDLRATSADGPAADAPARVALRTNAGDEQVGEVACSRGTAGHPLSDDELVAKFVAGCDHDDRAPALAHRVLGLDDEPTIDDLLRVCAALAERH